MSDSPGIVHPTAQRHPLFVRQNPHTGSFIYGAMTDQLLRRVSHAKCFTDSVTQRGLLAGITFVALRVLTAALVVFTSSVDLLFWTFRTVTIVFAYKDGLKLHLWKLASVIVVMTFGTSGILFGYLGDPYVVKPTAPIRRPSLQASILRDYISSKLNVEEAIRTKSEEQLKTLLFHIASYGPEEDCRALLESRGSFVHERNLDGTTLLHAALLNARVSLLTCLIGLGVRIEAENGYGLTSLYCAATQGLREATKILIEAGARVDVSNNRRVDLITSQILGISFGICGMIRPAAFSAHWQTVFLQICHNPDGGALRYSTVDLKAFRNQLERLINCIEKKDLVGVDSLYLELNMEKALENPFTRAFMLHYRQYGKAMSIMEQNHLQEMMQRQRGSLEALLAHLNKHAVVLGIA